MSQPPLPRRDFLKTIGMGTASLALPSCSLNLSDSRPNILFIMSDDHATHAVGCYGSRINKTPNIDRIAHGGMQFRQSFCTNSICAPSRAVFLTGKYSHVNGVTDNSESFDGSQSTFPKHLREAGYQTAMIGKWHLKSTPTGFDYWNILPGQGQYYNPDFIEMGNRHQIEGYVTDIITDLSLEWLRNRNKGSPFCLLCQHKAPHRNWMPAPRHLTLYDDIDIPLPETLFDDYESRSRAAHEQEMTLMSHFYEDWDLKLQDPQHDDQSIKDLWMRAYNRMNDAQKSAWDQAYGPKNNAFRAANPSGRELLVWRYQRYIKDYLRTIAAVDENIGRLLNFLNESGLDKNTIVIYTSDQGFFLGDHGWYDKRFMYEESLGIPMVVRYPEEIPESSTSEELTLNIDLAPTLLDYADVRIPPDIQGRSMRGIFKGEIQEDWRQAIYYHYYEYPAWHMVKRHYGIRTHRYKLIHFYHDIDAWELYDLREDPNELKNVYGNPAYSEIVSRLKRELADLQAKYGDEVIENG